MSVLPTFFISHGSPMHAIEPGDAGDAWRALAASIPRPRAMLIASAHWETGLPMLTGRDRLETIHDFGGFPEELYRIRYDAPGAPEIATSRARAAARCGLLGGDRWLSRHRPRRLGATAAHVPGP